MRACWDCLCRGSADLAGLELNSIDVHTATNSVGEYARIYEESQRKASNYFAALTGRSKLVPTASSCSRHLGVTGSKDLVSSLTREQQLGTTKLKSTKVTDIAPLAPGFDVSSSRSDPDSNAFGSLTHHRAHGLHAPDRALPAWVTPRMPPIKRPGRDLPDHWPTSPASRDRTQRSFQRLSQASLNGCSDDDRRREVMRERRIERKRAEDIAGYRAAFRLMDEDQSGQVCGANRCFGVGFR